MINKKIKNKKNTNNTINTIKTNNINNPDNILNNDIKLTKKQSIQLHKKTSIMLQNLESFNIKPNSKKNIITKNQYDDQYENKYETKVYGDHSKYINGIDIIYWINLDRSIDRRLKTEKVLSNFNIKNIRIKAFDGKLESDENLYGNFITDKFKMLKLEYACLLSHLNAIREFSNSNYDIALIMEDDISVDFSIYWNKSISKIISEAPKDWEIIMLGYNYITTLLKELYTDNTKDSKIYCTVSYIINKKSANKIMKEIYKNNKYYLTSKYDHQADIFLYKMLQTYTYKYPYFTYPTINISTIIVDNNVYLYPKIQSLQNWKLYFYENALINNIYNYLLGTNKNNTIKSEKIVKNDNIFFGEYYYKKNKIIISYNIIKVKNINTYIYFYKKFINMKVFYFDKFLSKNELIKELNKVRELKFILDYIKNNIM